MLSPEFRIDLTIGFRDSSYELKLFRNRPSAEETAEVDEGSEEQENRMQQVVARLFPNSTNSFFKKKVIDQTKPIVTLWMGGQIFQDIVEALFSEWIDEFPIALPDIAWSFQPNSTLNESLPELPLTLQEMLTVPPTEGLDFSDLTSAIIPTIAPTIADITSPITDLLGLKEFNLA